MEIAIEIKNVSKTFTGREGGRLSAVKDIDLTIHKGEFVVLLGPSGSGKSTLLRIICGLEKVSQGHVDFAQGLSTADIAFVFQQFALLPWLSVAENIGLGLMAKGTPEKERTEIVKKLLDRFGLEKFARTHVRELSGGMKQRVGIARALAVNPKILLLDEPFSELDSFTAEELRKDILQVWQERQLTVLMVSHMIPEALELADRIAVFTSRPGHIEKILTNPLSRPRPKRSQEFFALEDELAHLIRP